MPGVAELFQKANITALIYDPRSLVESDGEQGTEDRPVHEAGRTHEILDSSLALEVPFHDAGHSAIVPSGELLALVDGADVRVNEGRDGTGCTSCAHDVGCLPQFSPITSERGQHVQEHCSCVLAGGLELLGLVEVTRSRIVEGFLFVLICFLFFSSLSHFVLIQIAFVRIQPHLSALSCY